MTVDHSRSVVDEGLLATGHFDLVLKGIDRWGEPASLGWSEVTGEIYTFIVAPVSQQSMLVEVLGRVPDVQHARHVQAACPPRPDGLTDLAGAYEYFERR